MNLEDLSKPIKFKKMEYGIIYVAPDGKKFTNELEHKIYMDDYNAEKEFKFHEKLAKAGRRTDLIFFGWMILLFVGFVTLVACLE